MNTLDETGAIAPGYLADLVVLDRDPFAGPPGEIAQAAVALTFVEGAQVFAAERLRSDVREERNTVQLTTLGRGGPVVSRAGLGLMGMSGIYGAADDEESVATIRAALDAGITLLDTGDFYGMGHNELLLGRVLREVPRDSVFIQVKFGGMRDPRGMFIGHDARPAAVKNFLAYSLTRLGTDYIDLYQPARLDPQVPIEDTAGAIGEMIDAGYVRHSACPRSGAETIRRAHAVRPVAELQIEYSLMSRGIEAEILPALRELGISVTAYGILSRGLLNRDTAQLATVDPRARFPRFQDGQPAAQPGPAGRAGEDRRGSAG